MKRLIDISLSIVGLIIFSPIYLVVLFLIFLFNGWPLFFIQPRLGKNLVPFNIVKFRTMKLGISKNSEDDAIRQTKIGKILRKTSIDELPLLINVIKGEMSLVGPRPLLVKYKDRFNENQNRRHEILPGITGLAQIQGRNEISWSKKFDYDIHYVETQSFVMDLKILFKTLIAVLTLKGISPMDQDIMPEFMGTKKDESQRSNY